MRIYLVAVVLSLNLVYQVLGVPKHYLIETVDDENITMTDDDTFYDDNFDESGMMRYKLRKKMKND